jgi:hypothetical protein
VDIRQDAFTAALKVDSWSAASARIGVIPEMLAVVHGESRRTPQAPAAILRGSPEGSSTPGDDGYLHCRGRATCYMDGMFHRPTIAARIVLDDRSRLPWRFFGRLTTAALTA